MLYLAIALAATPTVAALTVWTRHRRALAHQRAEADYRQWREWVDSMHREMRRLVNDKEAAKLVGRTASTIRTWQSRNKLPGHHTPAGVRYMVAEVFLAERDIRQGRKGGRRPQAGTAA